MLIVIKYNIRYYRGAYGEGGKTQCASLKFLCVCGRGGGLKIVAKFSIYAKNKNGQVNNFNTKGSNTTEVNKI